MATVGINTISFPPTSSDQTYLAEAAVNLADQLLRQALAERTAVERRHGLKMAAMITDQAARQLSVAIADRVTRSRDDSRSARTLRHLFTSLGISKRFGFDQRAMMLAANLASNVVPAAVMFAARKILRAESQSVILAAEDAPLGRYLAARAAAGWRVNLNPLGEAILGEDEAQNRVDGLLKLLERDDVNYVSVKISAIFSQINVIAWRQTIDAIKDRLRPLYRSALSKDKFVNLDMEEYRDLALTAQMFKELLDEPEFRLLRAGIVLQAYLPDSWTMLQELTAWAQHRLARGGAPIKVRIVKGANLAMEDVEAALHGWYSAPYPTKAETDANFKRMLDYAIQPQNLAAIRIGVASHNLFDIALALALRQDRLIAEGVEFEMLEGMANHQARAVYRAAGGLLVYAPIVHKADFNNALAYLIRRLDENTSPENFLAHLFDMTPGSAAWKTQEQRFLDAWSNRNIVSHGLPARDFAAQARRLFQHARHRLDAAGRAGKARRGNCDSSRAHTTAAINRRFDIANGSASAAALGIAGR